jgi:hypothetical protein
MTNPLDLRLDGEPRVLFAAAGFRHLGLGARRR